MTPNDLGPKSATDHEVPGWAKNILSLADEFNALAKRIRDMPPEELEMSTAWRSGIGYYGGMDDALDAARSLASSLTDALGAARNGDAASPHPPAQSVESSS